MVEETLIKTLQYIASMRAIITGFTKYNSKQYADNLATILQHTIHRHYTGLFVHRSLDSVSITVVFKLITYHNVYNNDFIEILEN